MELKSEFFLLNWSTILLLEDGNLSFSQRMGTQIDGILGATLFKDYKITVNYNTERLRIERSQEKTTSCSGK